MYSLREKTRYPRRTFCPLMHLLYSIVIQYHITDAVVTSGLIDPCSICVSCSQVMFPSSDLLHDPMIALVTLMKAAAPAK